MTRSTDSSGNGPSEDAFELARGYLKHGPIDEYDLAALIDRIRADQRAATIAECEGIAWGEGTTGSKRAAAAIRALLFTSDGEKK